MDGKKRLKQVGFFITVVFLVLCLLFIFKNMKSKSKIEPGFLKKESPVETPFEETEEEELIQTDGNGNSETSETTVAVFHFKFQ